MMQPPASPVRDHMVMDGQQATQNTQQATQPDSQDANLALDSHLWGYLLPCNPERVIRQDFPRARPTITVGRDKTNNVGLPGKKVSNFHCEITWRGDNNREGAVIVKDMSSNGTYINGDKIGKGRFAVLKEGNEIAFGTAQPQTANNGAEDYRYIYRHMASGLPIDGLYAHYDLVKELGKGSFATVMQAMSKKNGQFYAVKMIQSNKLRAQQSPGTGQGALVPSESEKWAREISILEKLCHPNICQLKEVFFESSTINLVLEYVNGGDLLDYILARDGCVEDECRDITYQLCTAMAYIHERGITHRDLKPENVLMSTDVPPVVKVADFGLAKMVDSYTMLRTMCGTPSYLAPEVVLQVNHEGYQQVVDSWSVGVIVFSILTNVAPFETMTPADIEARGGLPGQPLTVRDQVTFRRVNWQHLTDRRVSELCIDFIRRLLQPDPKKRMTLTAALDHPWLAGHKREDYIQLQGRGGASGANGHGSGNGLDGDASMQSAAPDASMEDASQSQPGHMPGAFSNGGIQREPSRLHRRRDVIISAQEEPETNPAIPEPSQEMLQSAQAEEEQYYANNSRPNKRKGGPLDFDASLTPMPEESEEELEPETNGIKDLSMADVNAGQPPSSSPPNTRSKRAKSAPKGASPPKSQRGRGKLQPIVSSEDGADSSALQEGVEKPRRSARLNDTSPQKVRKAGRR